MSAVFRNIIAAAGLAIATHAVAQVTFYEREGFEGRSFSTERRIGHLDRYGFNDRASSAIVLRDRWEVCDGVRFTGRCVVLRPGNYPSLAAMALNDRVSSARALNANARVDDRRYAPAPLTSQVTFYEHESFAGRAFSTEEQVVSLRHSGFNDRASSAVVLVDRWEVCEDALFKGRCAVLRPGRYPSLAAMGLNDRVSSVRAVSGNARIDEHRYAPAPAAAYDYRRRHGEMLYEAQVKSARAVLGTPEQRCWVEQEQIPQARGNASASSAIVGAVIGGIIGHQIGGGTGRDLATVGGAVAGAAVGANVGRDSSAEQAQTRDVQRCENIPGQAHADYWDVTYEFRGQEHRVQMTDRPGRTITVNERGEPRA